MRRGRSELRHEDKVSSVEHRFGSVVVERDDVPFALVVGISLMDDADRAGWDDYSRVRRVGLMQTNSTSTSYIHCARFGES